MDSNQRAAIREAYRAGQLQVEAVDPSTGAAGLYPVKAVLRHQTAHKPIVRVTLCDGRHVETTMDHSLFFRRGDGVLPIEAGAIQVGDQIATVRDQVLEWLDVILVETLPPHEHTYDLSVPGPENFTLACGILAHNSYSIGGVSLDLERSSKYESLKRNAEEQWDKLTEAKARTVKYLRGLQQPRFGMGVRSAFGPATGRGVLSPRAFV